MPKVKKTTAASERAAREKAVAKPAKARAVKAVKNPDPEPVITKKGRRAKADKLTEAATKRAASSAKIAAKAAKAEQRAAKVGVKRPRAARATAEATAPAATTHDPAADDPTADLPIAEIALDRMLADSVLVEVKVGYERAKRSLTLADLGLDELPEQARQFVGQHLSLGSVRLLSDEKMKQLRSAEEVLRGIPREYGLSTPWNGVAVPKARFAQCAERMRAAEARVHQVFRSIVADYEQDVAEVRERFRTMAQIALSVRHGEAPRLIDLNGGQYSQKAVDEFVESVTARIPSVRAIRERFHCYWLAKRIGNPRDDAAATSEELAAAEARVAELQAEVDRLGTDPAVRAAQMELDAAEALLQAERELQVESQRQIEEVYRQEVADLLTETAVAVRDQLFTVLIESRDLLAKQGHLKSPSIQRLAKVVEYAQGLAFGDRRVLDMAGEIRQMLDQVPDYADAASAPMVRKALEDVASRVKGELIAMKRRPRLELADPERVTIRATRPGGARRGKKKDAEAAFAVAGAGTAYRRRFAVQTEVAE